jgi:hypothetical protein
VIRNHVSAGLVVDGVDDVECPNGKGIKFGALGWLRKIPQVHVLQSYKDIASRARC